VNTLEEVAAHCIGRMLHVAPCTKRILEFPTAF
jgi:hypothetical protein